MEGVVRMRHCGEVVGMVSGAGLAMNVVSMYESCMVEVRSMFSYIQFINW